MRTRQTVPLSDFDKRAILDDMQRYKTKDIVKFIEKDLEYGLTREEVEFYSNKKYSFEKILEDAFLEALELLEGNFDDVMHIVLDAIEETMNNEEDLNKKKQTLKDISALESNKSRMTDMLIDGIISKNEYENKADNLDNNNTQEKM